jgi:predicted GNAT superfamily acetyltransferase
MLDNELKSITRAAAGRATSLGQILLELNNAHARELSWLEPEQLEDLIGQAFRARRIGKVDAFLLALDQDANYISRSRYSRLCMWTGSWSHRRLEAAAVRDGSIVICSNTRSRPGMRRCFVK